MKKYLWIVALIAALTMVFVGCGDSDSGGDVTISFDVNQPASYAGPNITAPDPVKIKSGAAIGTLPAAPSGTGDYGLTFNGWFSAKTGGTLVTASSTFSSSTTVYAQWTEFNPDTEVAITFNLNYPDAPAAETIKGTIDEPFGTNWPGDPTRSGQVQGASGNDVWVFKGWKQYESGSGDTYTSTSPMPGSTIDNTVYAHWEPSSGWPVDTPPAGFDLTGTEKLILDNAWLAPYYFELPAGKTYQDYSGITFEIAVGPETLNKADSSRCMRVYGNYTKDLFDLFVPDSPSIGYFPDGMMIRSINGPDNNNAYILNDLSQRKSLADALASLGFEPQVWTWFKISHKIDGSGKNSGYNDAHKPADNAPGPFIFGLGVPGQGGGGSTEWLRNVLLVGNTGTESVKGLPLWFNEGGKEVPAFCGYDTTNGENGFKEAFREIPAGSGLQKAVLTK